jgi:hypothetical protein
MRPRTRVHETDTVRRKAKGGWNSKLKITTMESLILAQDER